METILYLVSNLLHVYAIYIFFKFILGESKFNRYVEATSFLTYYLFNSLGFIFFNNPLVNLVTNILPIFIISLQYKKSLGVKMFCTLSSCSMGMFIDLLTFSVLPSDSVLVKYDVIQVVLLLVLVFLFKYFFKNRKTDLKSGHIWFIVIISLGTITLGQLTIDKFNIRSMIISIVLLLINFLNFYMYDRDLKNLQMKHTLKLIETSNHAYQHQLQIMNESQKKLRFLKHDMKNHMYKVKSLIMNNEYDKATEYIEEMVESISVNSEYVNTGNKDVDCLLNYKLSLAKEMGTEFTCDVSLPENLIVSPFDMTTILGNLLDNSLNALKQTDNKFLIISIKYVKGTIHIDIENTYCYDYEKNKNKKQSFEHGLGLLSVKQVLEKYHGIIRTSQTDKRYFVNAFMYNSFE